ncbi:hypothetical protein QBC36DRAFT_323582 [Triangularia setosa]|uniref:Uncharacterized protein n=1 Tax=Triangularia setosa TaxID=2587417 RepID=A0AAN6WC02_9PEZI|nr:hypothetical protein QBC36DRAFT_323582 [Podospora setosa]
MPALRRGVASNDGTLTKVPISEGPPHVCGPWSSFRNWEPSTETTSRKGASAETRKPLNHRLHRARNSLNDPFEYGIFYLPAVQRSSPSLSSTISPTQWSGTRAWSFLVIALDSRSGGRGKERQATQGLLLSPSEADRAGRIESAAVPRSRSLPAHARIESSCQGTWSQCDGLGGSEATTPHALSTLPTQVLHHSHRQDSQASSPHALSGLQERGKTDSVAAGKAWVRKIRKGTKCVAFIHIFFQAGHHDTGPASCLPGSSCRELFVFCLGKSMFISPGHASICFSRRPF